MGTAIRDAFGVGSAARSPLQHVLGDDAGDRLSEQVLNALASGIVVADLVGQVIYLNAAASEELGAEVERCIGLDAQRLLGLSFHEACRTSEAPDRRCEARFTNLKGEPTHLGISIYPFAPEGPQVGYILHFRSLTDGLPDETAMRHMERLAAIGQMVAGFAHEVRNPLAALRALTDDLAYETPPDDPRAEHVSRIMRNVKRLEDLLRTSLQFGGPSHPSVMRHAPSSIVHAALELVRPRILQLGAQAGDLRVDVETTRDVLVDDGQLVQVLVILLNNALDATLDPSRVAVRLREEQRPEGMRVLFEVVDTGHGIPPERLSQVFNAFYTTKDSGTGLGLSIALKLVRENGGRLDVVSELGKGTTFTIDIGGVAP